MAQQTPTLATTMTPFPYAVAPDSYIEEAESMMREHSIHHLPVVESDNVVGLLSASDIRLALSVAKTGVLRVDAVHTSDPYIVDLHAPLHEVLTVMAERRAPACIVTRKGNLAGILTTTDICNALAELITPPDGNAAA